MSLFSPRRYQQPYPVHAYTLPMRAFTSFERSAKGVRFSCRMCGNCILQETAFICPMTCPKGLRNGPCGGSTPEHCYVDQTRPCTWYRIYERSERLGRTARLLEINAPLDGRKVGHETWLDLVRIYRDKASTSTPLTLCQTARLSRDLGPLLLRRPPAGLVEGRRSVPRARLRGAGTDLERSLRSGRFTVTAEIAPPLTANVDAMVRRRT